MEHLLILVPILWSSIYELIDSDCSFELQAGHQYHMKNLAPEVRKKSVPEKCCESMSNKLVGQHRTKPYCEAQSQFEMETFGSFWQILYDFVLLYILVF